MHSIEVQPSVNAALPPAWSSGRVPVQSPGMWLVALSLYAFAGTVARFRGLTLLDLPPCLVLPCVMLSVALAIGRATQRRRILSYMLEVFAFISLMKVPFVILSYAGYTVELPLWDREFLACDRFLGLDWPGFMHWLDRFPAATLALWIAYKSIWLQLVLYVVMTSIAGSKGEIDRLMRAILITMIACIGIGFIFPALGEISLYPHEQFGSLHFAANRGTIPVAEALRSGQLTEIALWEPQGLITFPSFHAAMAVILMAASLRRRMFSLIFIPLNLAMLASAYTEGGHYFIDIAAGGTIALAAWRLAAVICGAKAARSRDTSRVARKPQAATVALAREAAS